MGSLFSQLEAADIESLNVSLLLNELADQLNVFLLLKESFVPYQRRRRVSEA